MDILEKGKQLKKALDISKKTVKEDFAALNKNEERRELLESQFEPCVVRQNNVLAASDWHVAFQDRKLVNTLFRVADEYSIKTIIIPGDFMDCDNMKNTEKFLPLTFMDTFKGELAATREQLEELTKHFSKIYFCRGNHEKRWIQVNRGLVGMAELFAMTGISPKHYSVTMDDYITLFSGGQKWLLAHPMNYSPVQLSVASRIADRYQCSIFCAHGHQFAQGYDRSGNHQIVDGGGMFDPRQIEYLRRTTAHPAVHTGFYAIQDGFAIPFPGKSIFNGI